MGPGGLRGLQIRWPRPFGRGGGFDSLPLPPPPGLIALLNALELVENGLEPSVQQVMTIPGLTPTMLPPRVRVMTYFRMSAQASN